MAAASAGGFPVAKNRDGPPALVTASAAPPRPRRRAAIHPRKGVPLAAADNHTSTTSIYGSTDALKPKSGSTGQVSDTDEYAARAAAAVMRVLEEHHAVVHPELEARIAEANFAQSRGNIDPHHITNALRDLRDRRQIEWAEGTTRGGHTIETIQLTNTRRRATKTTATAARKRLLYARYTGWAQGTKRTHRASSDPPARRQCESPS